MHVQLVQRTWLLGGWDSGVLRGRWFGGAGQRKGWGCRRRLCASLQLLSASGRVTRALFSLPTRLSLYSCSQTVRSVMMVLITEAKRSCVWWARPSPKPTKLFPSPSPALRFVICSHRAPLYWPVASCSQSDPNLPCEVFPCTHAHTRSVLPPSSTPPLRGRVAKRKRTVESE